jgi:hypothetical protein
VTIGKPLPMYHALFLPILDDMQKAWSPIRLQEGAEGELAIGASVLAQDTFNDQLLPWKGSLLTSCHRAAANGCIGPATLCV